MINFGTDGWRAIIADGFTVQNVRYCAQAMANHLSDRGLAQKGLVVGYDTRFASERFAAVASEVMAGNGIKVYLCHQPTPTQVISLGVVRLHTAGAIVITASHNPPEWNGFKIKTAGGYSAPPDIEADIEKRLPDIIDQHRVKHISLNEGLIEGLIQYVDLYPVYLQQIATMLDLEEIRQAGLLVAVDSMFGAGSGYFERILGPAKTRVMEINAERNPCFPGMKQPEPIATNLSKLCEFIRQQRVGIGLATDGDADRIGIVDENGCPLTPSQIFGLLTLYLLEIRGQRGVIVKTVATTSMVDRLGELYGVPVVETGVGFKHVAPIMVAENAFIGGEESCGFGYRGHIPERDGILSGLFLLDLMCKTRKSPADLIEYLYAKVGPHHYHRTDVEFPVQERKSIIRRLNNCIPPRIAGLEVTEVNTIDGHRIRLIDGSWLLIRFSGTEPLLRIYAEASDLTAARALVAAGRNVLKV